MCQLAARAADCGDSASTAATYWLCARDRRPVLSARLGTHFHYPAACTSRTSYLVDILFLKGPLFSFLKGPHCQFIGIC